MTYTYHHELTDQQVHELGAAAAHDLNNLRQVHGSAITVECSIDGDGVVEVTDAHLGDHDIIADDQLHLDDLIDYGEMSTEVRESAKEEHEASKAEARLDSRRWRGEEVCPRGYDGR